MTAREAQKRKILHYMEAGYCITSYDAIGRFDCTRLSALIKELKDDGVPILYEWEYELDENGKVVKKWKKYFIAQ